jgi:hypothetical protein
MGCEEGFDFFGTCPILLNTFGGLRNFTFRGDFRNLRIQHEGRVEIEEEVLEAMRYHSCLSRLHDFQLTNEKPVEIRLDIRLHMFDAHNADAKGLVSIFFCEVASL